MGQLVVLGEAVLVQDFALGGAAVVVAEGAQAVRDAWDALPENVAMVLLTKRAAADLAHTGASRDRMLWMVMPS